MSVDWLGWLAPDSQWAYAVMLGFVLIMVLPLIVVFRLSVWRYPVRVFATIALAATPWVIWDLAATRAGHWRFDTDQITGAHLGLLPWEEWGFFVVVPLAVLLTWEAVGVVLQWAGHRKAHRRESAQ